MHYGATWTSARNPHAPLQVRCAGLSLLRALARVWTGGCGATPDKNSGKRGKAARRGLILGELSDGARSFTPCLLILFIGVTSFDRADLTTRKLVQGGSTGIEHSLPELGEKATYRCCGRSSQDDRWC
jgi:hypothetical protein